MALRVEWTEPFLRSYRLGRDYCGPPLVDYDGPFSDNGERETVVIRLLAVQFSAAKNNQLRTGADKGNPTV